MKAVEIFWQKVDNGSNLLDLLIHPRGLFKDPYMESGWGETTVNKSVGDYVWGLKVAAIEMRLGEELARSLPGWGFGNTLLVPCFKTN
jgi:hypothetical protein